MILTKNVAEDADRTSEDEERLGRLADVGQIIVEVELGQGSMTDTDWNPKYTLENTGSVSEVMLKGDAKSLQARSVKLVSQKYDTQALTTFESRCRTCDLLTHSL